MDDEPIYVKVVNVSEIRMALGVGEFIYFVQRLIDEPRHTPFWYELLDIIESRLMFG